MNKLHEIAAWVRALRRVPSMRALRWHLAQIMRILFWNERGEASVSAALLLPLLLGLGGGVLFVVSNMQHANTKHAEAPVVRSLFRSHYENDVELYYSVERGTILALVRADNDQYGGIVWRVTENRGAHWLGSECYECTAFMRPMFYWNRVIKRDAYAPLAAYPSIQAQYHNWIALQFEDW